MAADTGGLLPGRLVIGTHVPKIFQRCKKTIVFAASGNVRRGKSFPETAPRPPLPGNGFPWGGQVWGKVPGLDDSVPGTRTLVNLENGAMLFFLAPIPRHFCGPGGAFAGARPAERIEVFAPFYNPPLSRFFFPQTGPVPPPKKITPPIENFGAGRTWSPHYILGEGKKFFI